jgi:hypothetical protein
MPKKIGEGMSVDDFQYQHSNKKEFLDQVIQYFPPLQHFTKNGIEITSENLNLTPGVLSGISILV